MLHNQFWSLLFPMRFSRDFFSLFPCSFDARSLVVVLMEKKLNEVAAVERVSSKKCVLFSAINEHVVSPCQLWPNITWLSIDFEGFKPWSGDSRNKTRPAKVLVVANSHQKVFSWTHNVVKYTPKNFAFDYTLYWCWDNGKKSIWFISKADKLNTGYVR